MTKPARLTTFRRAALVLLAVLCVAACGKREWPIPVASEDKFRWRSVEIQRAQGCLILNCELSGNWRNVDTVKVLLEPVGDGPGDGCASCPFTPRTTLSFDPGSAGLRRDMNRIAITACELDPQKTYRVQLVGFNAFARIAPVASELVLSAPK
ncbi:MAG: hypothetical protein AB9900_10605 [Humidesulfovibrio sp.]